MTRAVIDECKERKDADLAKLLEGLDQVQRPVQGHNAFDEYHFADAEEDLVWQVHVMDRYLLVLTDAAHLQADLLFVVEVAFTVGFDVLAVWINDFRDQLPLVWCPLQILLDDLSLQQDTDVVLVILAQDLL